MATQAIVDCTGLNNFDNTEGEWPLENTGYFALQPTENDQGITWTVRGDPAIKPRHVPAPLLVMPTHTWPQESSKWSRALKEHDGSLPKASITTAGMAVAAVGTHIDCTLAVEGHDKSWSVSVFVRVGRLIEQVALRSSASLDSYGKGSWKAEALNFLLKHARTFEGADVNSHMPQLRGVADQILSSLQASGSFVSPMELQGRTVGLEINEDNFMEAMGGPVIQVMNGCYEAMNDAKLRTGCLTLKPNAIFCLGNHGPLALYQDFFLKTFGAPECPLISGAKAEAMMLYGASFIAESLEITAPEAPFNSVMTMESQNALLMSHILPTELCLRLTDHQGTLDTAVSSLLLEAKHILPAEGMVFHQMVPSGLVGKCLVDLTAEGVACTDKAFAPMSAPEVLVLLHFSQRLHMALEVKAGAELVGISPWCTASMPHVPSGGVPPPSGGAAPEAEQQGSSGGAPGAEAGADARPRNGKGPAQEEDGSGPSRPRQQGEGSSGGAASGVSDDGAGPSQPHKDGDRTGFAESTSGL